MMRWDASPQDYFFKAVFRDSQLFTARCPECFSFGHKNGERGAQGNLTTVGRRWQGKIIHRRRRAEPDGDLTPRRQGAKGGGTSNNQHRTPKAFGVGCFPCASPRLCV